MIAVPAATPVTIPVEDPIVLTAILLLAHVPPEVASVKEEVSPIHTALPPEIVTGIGLTVAAVV